MEHVVFYPAPDGSPAFRRVGSLDDAVRFVEHLRNIEGVSEVSVHALSAVPLAFRAYYRVEVPADEVAPMAEPVAEVVEPEVADVEPVAEPMVAEAEPVADEVAPEVADMPEQAMPEPVMAEAAMTVAPASPNGKRSLGFFAH